MIKFRQKDYAAPAVAAAMGGGMGLMNALTAGSLGLGVLQMGQASKQSKLAEEQQQEALKAQQRENAKLTKSLDKLAKAAEANPQASIQAAQAGHLVGKSKVFAVPATATKSLSSLGKKLATSARGIARNAKSFGKEAINAVGVKGGENGTGIGKIGKTMIGMATTGVISAGAAYAVDKGVTADARRVGIMPRQSEKQKSYAMPSAAASSIMSKAGTYLKKGAKYAFSKQNLLKKDHLFMGAFAVMPAAGYLGQRAQFKSQLKNQDSQSSVVPKNSQTQTTNNYQQKSYAAPATLLKGAVSNTASRSKGLFKNWDGMRTITGGAAKLGSFGMFGKREIQAYGQRLAKGNHSWSKKTGKWIQENPNKANIAGAIIGAGAVKASWTGAENLTKKALNKVDKDAYAYEKYQNQEVK